jgi:tRNA(Ile)-lysidine synthetase-like protein
MFNILGKFPDKFYLAYSGGTDSSFALHFLQKKNFKLLYVNHQENDSHTGQEFAKVQAEKYKKELVAETISRGKLRDESHEEYWRNMRYEVFHRQDAPVVTCHQLNDCVETWLFNCLHGNPRTIPYSNGNVIRPFLCVPKSYILQYLCRHDPMVFYEESNLNMNFARNAIRANLIPEALKIQPGLLTTVRKLVEEQYERQKHEI